MTVHVLDDYYLAITLLVTVGYQLLFFAVAFSLKFDKLTDFAGGTNFVVLAIITLSFSGVQYARNIVASIFLILWGLRLSGFLLFRILKTGKDDRFDTMRDKFLPFLGFWVFQMLWVWTVSLPVTILNSPRITRHTPLPAFGTATDITGTILFASGFLIEAISDAQKYRFRSGPGAKDKKLFMNSGLWRYSRHPNYFGEIILHFGIWLITISTSTNGGPAVKGHDAAAQFAAVVGPLFLSALLLFLSGLTLQEKPSAKKRYEKGLGWEEYKEYLTRTSILIPMPRRVWERLPVAVKRTVGFEFPLYLFDPAKDAEVHAEDRDDQALRGNARGRAAV